MTKGRSRRPRDGGISLVAVILLGGLLFFPVLASVRLAQSHKPLVVFGYLAAISCLTLWLYWTDKRRAEAGRWRIDEFRLHLAELFGGWPAAFLARRVFRHKISKQSYQVVFWLIVVLHEAVWFDFLSEWR